MQNHENAMLAFARLARISHEKRQTLGRDRFLLLAGEQACKAGWPEVADRCRELILLSNPRHLLSKSASFADCLRSEEGAGLFPTLQKFCTFERAEHLLKERGETPVDPDQDAGAAALNEISSVDVSAVD